MFRRRRPGWSGRRRRGTAGTPPPGATPPTKASVPWAAPRASRISSSEPRRVLPIAAAPTRNAWASSPRAQNCFSTARFRAWPAARRRSWPVVVGVEDRGAARGGEFVFGHDHPGGGFDQADRAVIDHHGHAGADQPGGHRVAGRGVPDTGQPVDLAQHRRRPDLQPQRRQWSQQFTFDRSAARRGPRRSPNAPRR